VSTFILLYLRIADGFSNQRWLPALITRLSIGIMFAISGWGKLNHLEGVIEYFGTLGVPAPATMAPFVATVEFAGGAFLILGLFTRLVSIPLIITMIVALATAKREEITTFTDIFGLSEFLIALALVWLGFNGAGGVSFDALLSSQFSSMKKERPSRYNEGMNFIPKERD
jgi:putative oxidoreductase